LRAGNKQATSATTASSNAAETSLQINPRMCK
jgi:hypothetical protein